jgi:chromosome segregation ATPase
VDTTIQVSENDLFEIIGRGQVELFAKEKELIAYRTQFEKVKPLLVEGETSKAAKAALETSNKQLADKNVQLDQALTEARKERDALRADAAKKATQADGVQRALDEATKNVAILSQSVESEQKRFAELHQTYTTLQASIAQKKNKK